MAVSVTIVDVAKAASVSIKTVSRVVNKEANVRPATREKVLAVIERLHYRPNLSARGLAGKRSYMIGLLYDSPSPSYLANLQAGVLEACQDVNYGLALRPVAYGDAELCTKVIDWLRHTMVDGVLLTPPLCDSVALIDAIKDAGVPCVVVSSTGPGSVPAVMIDEKEAARQMTQHLIQSGHRSIAFIKGHPDHYASKQRFDGFVQAMQEAALTVDTDLVKQGYFDFSSGKKIGEDMLNTHSHPTAIFASNDDMAAGVIHAAHRLKLSVPGEIAVAGFDDTPLSRQIWPSLTTVRQPIRRIGQSACDMLLASIADGGCQNADTSTIEQLDFELKIRGSSAPE